MYGNFFLLDPYKKMQFYTSTFASSRLQLGITNNNNMIDFYFTMEENNSLKSTDSFCVKSLTTNIALNRKFLTLKFHHFS